MSSRFERGVNVDGANELSRQSFRGVIRRLVLRKLQPAILRLAHGLPASIDVPVKVASDLRSHPFSNDDPPLQQSFSSVISKVKVEPETALKNVAWSLLFWPVSLIRQGRTARPGRCPAVSAEHEEGKTARSFCRRLPFPCWSWDASLPNARGRRDGKAAGSVLPGIHHVR